MITVEEKIMVRRFVCSHDSCLIYHVLNSMTVMKSIDNVEYLPEKMEKRWPEKKSIDIGHYLRGQSKCGILNCSKLLT